jgi:spore coat protein H
VDQYLVYLATMAVIQNTDHIKKNYFLYRDPDAADDRWIIIPWDLDVSFGHLWTEEHDVWDETMFFDEPVEFTNYRNHLIEKLLIQPPFLVRYYDFVDHILDTTFTPEFINGRIENALCRGTPDIIADEKKRAENTEYLDRVQELRDFVDKRRAFILSAK